MTPEQAALRTYGGYRRVPGQRFRHPVVGDLELTFEPLPLAAGSGLTLFVYTAEPGSNSEEALNLLASWAGTLDQVEAAHT